MSLGNNIENFAQLSNEHNMCTPESKPVPAIPAPFKLPVCNSKGTCVNLPGIQRSPGVYEFTFRGFSTPPSSLETTTPAHTSNQTEKNIALESPSSTDSFFKQAVERFGTTGLVVGTLGLITYGAYKGYNSLFAKKAEKQEAAVSTKDQQETLNKTIEALSEAFDDKKVVIDHLLSKDIDFPIGKKEVTPIQLGTKRKASLYKETDNEDIESNEKPATKKKRPN